MMHPARRSSAQGGTDADCYVRAVGGVHDKRDGESSIALETGIPVIAIPTRYTV